MVIKINMNNKNIFKNIRIDVEENPKLVRGLDYMIM